MTTSDKKGNTMRATEHSFERKKKSYIEINYLKKTKSAIRNLTQIISQDEWQCQRIKKKKKS